MGKQATSLVLRICSMLVIFMLLLHNCSFICSHEAWKKFFALEKDSTLMARFVPCLCMQLLKIPWPLLQNWNQTKKKKRTSTRFSMWLHLIALGKSFLSAISNDNLNHCDQFLVYSWLISKVACFDVIIVIPCLDKL